MSKKKYVAAIYLRLSKEDGDKEESYEEYLRIINGGEKLAG